MHRAGSFAARLRSAAPYAVVFAAAAWLYADAGQFAGLARPGELGPAFWPRAVLLLLMAVCAGAAARRFVFGHAPRGVEPLASIAAEASEGEKAEAPVEMESGPATHPWLLLGGIALSVAYVASLEWLGFFLATAAYLALFMVLGRYRRYGMIAATSVLGSLAFVFVFMKIVYVSLPLGSGPFQALSVALLSALGVR